ncbi:TPA: hypothetical protein ACPIZ7_001329 [Haemophilus influenzae]|uniref:Uncharacterized protein n=2 Tax=Haemophilus influenzae TaxID=727 RepID=A0A0H3PF96_HAEI3|nr:MULTISPECIES: hypothetical protein [Gammaproteobacteria]EDK09586.1 hypothetical protein CGSHiHH_00753 [Haemophilus influenzae PittHH]DAN85121.1 MAG TPA: hypothetical protein [Caudoviricetes sp.]AKA45990.1 hypothetical protein C645_00575 [Haemophilus influenzae 2019]AWP56218.1 hypothetical protein DLK00_09170 [Haemophilus influenzae]AXP37799.1 hypothetical protein CH582_04090 [Haemophilus influenzae]
MKTTTSFDFLESLIVLSCVVGFGYTLYSFLTFAASQLDFVQIIFAVFIWVIAWQIIGAVLFFAYRLGSGRLFSKANK